MTKWIYTLLLFAGGLLFAAILPPLQTADEATHLMRGIQLARGEIRGEINNDAIGCQIPVSVHADLRAHGGMIAQASVGMRASTWRILYRQSGPIRGEGEDTFAPCQFQHYPPVAHLPVAVGVVVGKVFDLKTVTTIYVGRVVNLLAACAVMLAIFALCETRPRVQLVFFGLAAAPANLSLFASLSADPITVVTAFLVFALCLRLKDQWTERTFWTVVLAGAVLGLCKNVYFPLVALSFPAIWTRPESFGKRIGRMAIVSLAAVAPLSLWMYYIRDFTSQPAIARSGASPSGQLQIIMEAPLAFVRAWAGYLWHDWVYLRRSVIGHMGWGDNWIPGWLADAYLIGLTVFALVGQRDSSEKRWDWIDALWRLLLCAGVAFMIYSALYVMTGRGMVLRTQGRYQMPLLPLIFASLPIALYISSRAFRWWRIAAIVLWCVAMTLSAIEVSGRYWGEQRASFWLGEMARSHREQNAHRAVFGKRENGDFVLRASAPTVFDLKLPPLERREVTVEYGILDGAWLKDNKSDGVEFAIAAKRPGKSAEVIWQRMINPREVAEDRGAHTATVPIPTEVTSLTFTTSPGPAKDNKWDWSYWRRLEFGE